MVRALDGMEWERVEGRDEEREAQLLCAAIVKSAARGFGARHGSAARGE